MNSTRPLGACDVCGDEPAVGVASSSLGGFSLAYGARCLRMNAEPAGMLRGIVEDCGGLEHIAPWVHSLTGYENGEYRSLAELMATKESGTTASPSPEKRS